MSTSKALAVIGKKAKPAEEVKAEPVKLESLLVHSSLLLAAEATTPRKPTGTFRDGILLHSQGKVGRIVGADGPRIFIASFPPEKEKLPSWMKDGVLVSASGLRKRVQLILGSQTSPMIRLSHVRGGGSILVSDLDDDAIFKLPLMVRSEYPDYEKLIGPGSFADIDEEGNVRGREWQPLGINSTYLKSVGEIAKTLEAGLPKSKRTEGGMIIRAYNGGDPAAPMIFDFTGWPGVVLVMSTARLANSSITKETAAILAPAVKLTVAALRAHATRNLAWAEATSDPHLKAEFEAKAQTFVERVASILGRTPGVAAIEQDKKPTPEPETKPTPEPEAEPVIDRDEDDPQAKAKPVGEPEVKRTSIKVNRRKAA